MTTGTENSASRELNWLRQAQAGDRAAFGRIVIAFQDRLYNAMLKLTHNPDEARELTQETFLRALASLQSFRSESSPYTWLFRIATNLALSDLRQANRRRIVSLERTGDQAAGLVMPQIETRERQEMVVRALSRVEPDQRILLILRDIEQLDYAEIAEILELPLGTVKSRLFRARLALREELKDYFETP